MNPKDVQTAVARALEPFIDQGLFCVVFGFCCQDAEGNLCDYGQALVPCQPRDHEEEVMRDDAANKVGSLAAELMRNVFGDPSD